MDSMKQTHSHTYSFSPLTEAKFQKLVNKFPKLSSLVIWALHFIQEEEGYISKEAMEYVAERANVSVAWVSGVVSFYEKFQEKPIGKYHIKLCYNVACWMAGSDQIDECIVKKLGIQCNQTSEDGMFTYTRTQECLSACDKAPAVLVNDDYYEDLDVIKMLTLIDNLRSQFS